MDYKKLKIEQVVITRNVEDLEAKTGNIYETVAIISKRANQISLELKEELHNKIAEFASQGDALEEIFENKEQIEIAKFYEHLPKPTLIAINEFLNGEIYARNPLKEHNENLN
ncbi:MAG TPA: DNA-directed RNA polymerase subunit omega [Bacteroidales bacterium]|nr:DNA-directed RNA polymerase subunit omega [Bacteroidales bacterium]